MSVAILVPVLGRPHRVRALVESIRLATAARHRIVFVCDPWDGSQIDAVCAAGLDPLIVEGSYVQKINAAAHATADPLLFLAADDLRFHEGWLEAAASALSDSIEVVGTNDLGNPKVRAGEHATHSLLTRRYAERGTVDGPGILHPGYHHNFCDTEFVATAKARGAWAFAADSIVEHLHPEWGKGEPDATYRKGAEYWDADRALFRSRRALWT